MAIERQQNWLGNQRVDVPHLRSIESAVTRDFDVLAGIAMGGKEPLVVKGFEILTAGVTRPENLQIKVAGSLAIHYMATDSGSIFAIPEDAANEVLANTNAKMAGGFTASAVNYIGLDFYRQEDDATADLVAFINTSSLVESVLRTPLARTLTYRINVSTNPFESAPGILPVAAVETDAQNVIVSVQDCRNLMFRLGSGGSSPDIQNAYPWAQGRAEGTGFAGGDKAINSLKDWMDAVMTRLWEMGGGQTWYSPACDRNLRLTYAGSPFASNGEYFEWDGTNLHWKGLSVVFDNSVGSYNNISDQTVDAAGLTNLSDGDCLFVDLDRSQNLSGGSSLVPVKASLIALGYNTRGARLVIAWRKGTNVFVRDQVWPVNHSQTAATKLALGSVAVSATPSVPAFPVATLCESGVAIASGLSRGAGDFGFGDLTIGGAANDDNIILRADGAAILGYGLGTAATPITILQSTTPLASDTAGKAILIRAPLSGGDPTLYEQISLENNGAIAFNRVTNTPATPGAGVTVPKAKVFLRQKSIAGTNRDQLCAMWSDGRVATIAEDIPLNEVLSVYPWNFTASVGVGGPSDFDPSKAWYYYISGAGGNIAIASPVAITKPVNGVVSFTLSSAFPGQSYIGTYKTAANCHANSKWVMEGTWGLSTSGVLADEMACSELFWGASKDASIPGGATRGVYLRKRNTDANWQLETKDGVTTTLTDTGVVANVEHRFKIQWEGSGITGGSSTVKVWIDNALVVTQTANLPIYPLGGVMGGVRTGAGVAALHLECGPVVIKSYY